MCVCPFIRVLWPTYLRIRTKRTHLYVLCICYPVLLLLLLCRFVYSDNTRIQHSFEIHGLLLVNVQFFGWIFDLFFYYSLRCCLYLFYDVCTHYAVVVCYMMIYVNLVEFNSNFVDINTSIENIVCVCMCAKWQRTLKIIVGLFPCDASDISHVPNSYAYTHERIHKKIEIFFFRQHQYNFFIVLAAAAAAAIVECCKYRIQTTKRDSMRSLDLFLLHITP